MMREKIKILFLAANPSDTVYRLQLDKEVSEITEKLRSSSHGDSFELISEWSVKPDVLQAMLFRHKPHILHFSGHASEERGIVLEDESGKSVPLSKQTFTRLMKLAKGSIRIVVLNACNTKGQAEFLKDNIDFTIAMNRPVKDRAARVLSAYFYQALAFGFSVQDAFESALIQVDMNQSDQADIPELHIRRGVDPSKPFLPGADAQQQDDAPPKANSPAGNHYETNGGIINTAGRDVTIHGDQVAQKHENHYTHPGKK
jgi:hypothetical protein